MNEFPEDLKKVFREYREAHPDLDPSASFTPVLWQKIEARRRTAGSMMMLRRLAQAFAGLAVTAAFVLGVFVIPHLQDRAEVQSASYAEVVANDEAQQEVAKAFTIPAAYVPPAVPFDEDPQ
jgi:cbb3-type cytochrome oxidase subunit 3